MTVLTRGEDTYLGQLHKVYTEGADRKDRTGTGTIGLFGLTAEYDVSNFCIPLLHTKRIHVRSVVEELRWMIKGDTDNRSLNAAGVTIWDEWAPDDGDLGRIYGAQWRDWIAPDGQGIDQLRRLLEGLRDDPYGRRHIVTAWNPGELDDMALPPCHCFYQAYVRADGGLELMMYQRSADMFLGVPFNIAGYSILLCLIAGALDREPVKFKHVIGDAHIYSNHVEQVQEQLRRATGPDIVREADITRCTDSLLGPHIGIVWRRADKIGALLAGDFEIIVDDYSPMAAIPAPVAV